jgi:hypothetical protein|nr:MAG TPA: hypothetical protein [Caudoviricetes sp.]
MKIYTAGFKDNYAYSTEKDKKRTRERIGKRECIDGELYAVMLSIGENYDKDNILRVIHRDKRVKKVFGSQKHYLSNYIQNLYHLI